MKIYSFLFFALLFCAKNLNSQCLVAYPTIKITDTPTNDPQFWNSQAFYDNLAKVNDLFETSTQLTIELRDTCGGVPPVISFRLWLDLNNDNQVDTYIDSDPNPPKGKIIVGNGALGLGKLEFFDNRSVPNFQKYSFALEQTVNGDVRTAALIWQSGNISVQPLLPYGLHLMEWFCDGKLVARMKFRIKDNLPPEFVVNQKLTLNIFGTNPMMIHLDDFLLYGEGGSVQYSMRRAGTGTGFPSDAGDAIQKIFLDCQNLGLNEIEIWAKDLYNNLSSQIVKVYLEDPFGHCKAWGDFNLCFCTPEGEKIMNVDVKAWDNQMPPNSIDVSFISSTGCFSIDTLLAVNMDFKFEFSKNDNSANGVDWEDLQIIEQHISGVNVIKDPYKLIAADVNRSGSVTMTDMLEMRNLIEGNISQFSSGKSWIFIEKDFVFPDPANPFASNFISPYTFNNQYKTEYYGIKLGDLNASAIPDFTHAGEDRNFDQQKENNRNGLVSIFPNPAEDIVLIQFNSIIEQQIRYELYDWYGRCLLQGRFDNAIEQSVFPLEMSGIPSGSYLLKVFAGNIHFNQVVLKK